MQCTERGVLTIHSHCSARQCCALNGAWWHEPNTITDRTDSREQSVDAKIIIIKRKKYK